MEVRRWIIWEKICQVRDSSHTYIKVKSKWIKEWNVKNMQDPEKIDYVADIGRERY